MSWPRCRTITGNSVSAFCDVDNEVIDTFEGSLIQDLKTPENLKQLILAARTAVERKNKILKPWSFESI